MFPHKILIYLDDQRMSIFVTQPTDGPGYYIYPETNPGQTSFIYPNTEGIYVVQEAENIPYQIFFFDSAGANTAVATGNIPVIKKLLDYGIRPTQTGVDLAAVNNDVPMIELLAGLEIYPSQIGIEAAKMHSDGYIIRFLTYSGYLNGDDLGGLEQQFQQFKF